jgi:hypothetical protein
VEGSVVALVEESHTAPGQVMKAKPDRPRFETQILRHHVVPLCKEKGCELHPDYAQVFITLHKRKGGQDVRYFVAQSTS